MWLELVAFVWQHHRQYSLVVLVPSIRRVWVGDIITELLLSGCSKSTGTSVCSTTAKYEREFLE